MAGDNHSTEDELVKFEEKYARILSQDPSSVTFIFLAQVLHKQGKVDKAIKVLINGLKYNRNSVTGRFLLGKIYYDRWLIEQAKREFHAVIGLAPDNLDVQAYVRFMVSGATECPIDSQGRTLLPAFLREHAKLGREVTIAGVGTRIEIWNKALFDENQTRTQENFQRIASVVAGLDR